MRSRLVSIIVAATLVLAMAACSMWSEKKHPNWADATGGEHFERLLWREIQARDTNEIERHIAANATFHTATATLSRADFLARVQLMKLESIVLSDFQVTPHRNAMTVSYRATLRGTDATGQPLPSEPIRMVSVWQREPSGWTMILHVEIR